MSQVATQVVYKQVGWMPCVACSDTKRKVGVMWLGVNRFTGEDENIPCVECKGTGQVPRYKVFDILTGQEIDYETYGRKQSGEPLILIGG